MRNPFILSIVYGGETKGRSIKINKSPAGAAASRTFLRGVHKSLALAGEESIQGTWLSTLHKGVDLIEERSFATLFDTLALVLGEARRKLHSLDRVGAKITRLDRCQDKTGILQA